MNIKHEYIESAIIDNFMIYNVMYFRVNVNQLN